VSPSLPSPGKPSYMFHCCIYLDFQFYAWRKNSSLNLVFATVQLVYVTSNSSSLEMDDRHNRFNREITLSLTPEYHIRHLDLNFKNWKLHSLVEFLSTLPSLVTLQFKSFCCCNYIYSWLNIDMWDQTLQNLNALHRIAIDIRLAIPMRLRNKSVNTFNQLAAQKIETCKRINLTVAWRIKQPNRGCLQISASLNMDMD
jgi:hypothetical protein